MTSKKTPNAVDVHVGKRVRLRRMMLGISQEKLADHCDITFQQIQKYEKGTNRIGASRLHQISQILKVEPSFFFEGLSTTHDISAADQALMNATHVPGCMELVRRFERMTPAGRKALLQTSEAIIEAKAPPAIVAA